MRLALGTVQFGLDYGVNNPQGKTLDSELDSILNLAAKHNIDLLDTATAYGNAIERLGKRDLSPFKVVSKLKPIQGERLATVDIDNCLQEVENTVKQLNVTQLHAIMLHNAGDLSKPECDVLLQELKRSQFATKVGASFYSQQPILNLCKSNQLDIVQLPLNVADQSALNTGLLNQLKQNGCEVHIRSVFLQGLLLMTSIPDYFEPWKNWFRHYKQLIASLDTNPIELCLGIAKHLNSVDRIVIGANSLGQLADIINSYNKCDIDHSQLVSLATEDENFINPVNWKL
ncbi:aldo/keto reductase [Pseudoalteromonas sp. M8]|uniref:aldo/keto reductase n=1 Tax=Pseudoalteromonas sp. M8 TaxID=2692624 RepID=UPI001BAC2264|nr:aldo/keto reductase [Pseudoalteromonas sp. M8]QUI70400.1 aldo/keto reductase [Pseudoalteromonas sp. M8]